MNSCYTSAETLRLAKRINNPKRSYLLVNPLQAKHLPVSPSEALKLMQCLGRNLAAEFPHTRLVIGFAETATAIGAMAASCFGKDCVYIHTTREPLPEGGALEFQEEHSHAVEQALDCRNLAGWLGQTRTVLFIDDELSTGKTLINIVDKLAERFPELREKELVAASILNRLTPENEARLNAAGIVSRCLVKLPEEDYTQAVERFSVTEAPPPTGMPQAWERVPFSLCDPRGGVLSFDYLDTCRREAEALLNGFRKALKPEERILVLGSEECMFPALILGAVLERQGGWQTRCHATTRSPIGICPQPDYPIREGWRLQSLYDASRTVFLYNLEYYGAVITVSEKAEEAGLRALSAALQVHGCGRQFLVGGAD